MIVINDIDPVAELHCDKCGKLLDYEAASLPHTQWGCGYALCSECDYIEKVHEELM